MHRGQWSGAHTRLQATNVREVLSSDRRLGMYGCFAARVGFSDSQLAVGAGAGGAVFYQVVHYIVLLGE